MRPQHSRLKSVDFWSSYALICLLAVVTGAARLPDDEVQALKDIGAALRKTSWDFNVDPCGGVPPWNVSEPNDAVTCNCSYSNSAVCHVTSVSLKRQSLQGTLPPDFARLPYLQNLDLSLNYLNGTIPKELGSLAYLQEISFLGNRLTGQIPKEIGNISTLRSFVAEFNKLSGDLPEELGNLSRLQRLFLTSNYFTGKLPSTLAKLTALTEVWLGDNQFSGTIPEFIQYWTNVSTLVLQASGFQGPIPSGIGALQNLTDLRITDVSGAESRFPQLSSTKLQWLVLRNCNLAGDLPDYLGDLTELSILDVSFNNLSGKITDNKSSSLATVDHLYLTGNLFTGLIPDWIINGGQNKIRDLSYNSFTNEDTVCTNSNGNVNLFASSSVLNNSLESVSCLSSVSCPATRYNLSINCGGSAMTVGSIVYDADINNGKKAHYYKGDGYYWAYSSTGHFMDNSTNQDVYIVSNTSTLSMESPELYMNARVSPISLTYYGFCLTNGTYNISLHFAEIMFTGDQNYSSLGRRYFDVYIQGKLELKDFNIEDAAGGVGKLIIRSFMTKVTSSTLEIRFEWVGRGTTAIPYKGVYGPLISAISASITDQRHSGSKLSAGGIFGIVAGIAVVIFLILFVLWRRGCLGQKSVLARDFEGLQLQTGSFSLRQIKVATDNFSDANKIGEGGFGPVHKGVLPDGRVVAVKQLSSKSKQGNREFLNEIGMISALQHPNLVKLHGCCIEGNQLLLVYEYLENNSLARALFGTYEHRLKLDWRTRHMICVGIARGLAFLHEESRLKVVHRDIKATNVLLDRDLNPKISDFGLARLDDEDDTHISTRIAGTYGYMAPEYAMHGYLTEKADVYSFGIVALEIVSGRSNTSHKLKGECLYLLSWAQALKEKGTLMDLIDPRLGPDFNVDQVMVMIDVALLCTNMSPSARPTMSSVVRMLEGDEAVPRVVPDSSVSNDEAKLEAMRRHFMGLGEKGAEESREMNIEATASDVPLTASSSSSKDLYPVIWSSNYWQKRI